MIFLATTNKETRAMLMQQAGSQTSPPPRSSIPPLGRDIRERWWLSGGPSGGEQRLTSHSAQDSMPYRWAA